MPTAVLFDVDGTLVTFKFDVRGTRQALIAEISRGGLDTSTLSLSSPTQQIIDAARSQLLERGQGGDFLPLKKKLYTILDAFEEESAKEASVFPGTRETLEYLRQRSARLAVLTNSGRQAAFAVLRKSGILDCFEFVLTRDDVESMKPSPEGVLLAVSHFGLPREETYYVGDGVYDILAAKEAGLKVVSVATGIYDSDRLKKEGADFVIGSLSDLPRTLGL